MIGRRNERWFEFKGVNLDRMCGVKLMDADVYPLAKLRGTALVASGRNGDLFQSDDSYETIQLKRVIRFDALRLDEVAGLLHGSGSLRFSAWDDRTFDARVDKIDDPKIVVKSPHCQIIETTVTFICQPFKRLYPEAVPFFPSWPSEITGISDPIEFHGNAVALPLIELEISRDPDMATTATTDITLIIGNMWMEFRGVADERIYIDSETMDVYAYGDDDLPVSKNNISSGEPFRLLPDVSNTVEILSSEVGFFATAKITPRWRWF